MPRFEDAPVTWIILIVYLAAAAWTGLLDPTTESLVSHGAAVGLLLPDEPWRLVSHAFLHGGLIHLAFNSMALTWVGPTLERALGGTRFALLYFITAIAGGIMGSLFQPEITPLVGGSGALFGMFGGTIALFTRMGRSQLEFLDYHGPRSILGLVAANLVIGFLLPMVSNAAHIGGLIAGFVLTYLFYARGRTGPDGLTRIIQAGWIALFLAGMLYTARPTLSLLWSVREAMHGATLEIREAHDRRLRNEGYPLKAAEAEFREVLPQVWGETGRRVVKRLFD